MATGRRAHLLLGTHRHNAGGSYPGSVRRLEFLEFVVGNVGIEIAALHPVVSLWLRPRPGSVTLVSAITAAYPGFVGWFAARELRRSPSPFLLAAQPAVASVIAGAGSPAQVRENARAARWEPSTEDLTELDTIFRRVPRVALF